MPLTAQVAAVSVGIFEDEAVLDLNYAEDSHAIVDCNVVMTSKGEFIEVQGTGEAVRLRIPSCASCSDSTAQLPDAEPASRPR